LFVSHNMSAMRTLTTTAVLLAGGRLIATGPVRDVIAQYMQDDESIVRSEMIYDPSEASTGEATLRVVRLLDEQGRPRADFTSDEPLMIEIEFDCGDVSYLQLGAEVVDQNGVTLFRTFSDDMVNNWQLASSRGPRHRARCLLPAKLFNAGQYRARALLRTERDAELTGPERTPMFQMIFDVPNADITAGGRAGVVAPILQWDFMPAKTLHAEQRSAASHIGRPLEI
jgi:lipopolysaccharide transport system ATP-binding protein